VLLLCIMQLLEVAWYTLWDRTCSILYSKDHDNFMSDQSEILVWGQEVTTSLTNKSTWSAKHDWKGGKSSDVIWSKEQRVSSICMIMSSLSGFSILAGTICKKNSAWNMLLDLSWYKKLHDTSIAILALPCNRAFTDIWFDPTLKSL
jgi:hypothetical protein